MSASLRPAGSGRPADVGAFFRATTSPQAALVFGGVGDLPGDWPNVVGLDAGNAQLGHALGYVCEIRKDALVLLNPLGEGVLKTDLPALDDAWLHQVRRTESSAVYLLVSPFGDDPAEVALSTAAGATPVLAASVRTSVSHDFGAMPEAGRNDPCPCGSGRKFKKCHGAAS
jgi:hypothetical protein